MVTPADNQSSRRRDPDLPRRPRGLGGRSLADLTVATWTVSQVRAALRQHMEGDFHRSALLCDAARGDDRVKSDLRTRVMAVTGLPFRLDPSPAGDQRRAKAVAAELDARWAKLFPGSLVRQLLRAALLVGAAHGPCEWETSGGLWWPRVDPWHGQHLRHDPTRNVFETQSTAGPLDVVPGDGSWFLFEPEGSRGWMDASVRGLAVPYLIRTHGRRDWARFCEKHGLPITGAVVPEDADVGDKDDFFEDLRAMGSEGIVMLPKDRDGRGFGLEMIEPKNVGAWKSFEAILYHCDVSIAVELLGQASNAQEGGSYAKAAALNTLRQDLLEADAAALAEAIREQVLRPWAHFNYGDADLAPLPVWDATQPEDAKRLADTWQTTGTALVTWQTAAEKAGFEVDFEAAAARVGMPVRRAPKPTPAPVTDPSEEN